MENRDLRFSFLAVFVFSSVVVPASAIFSPKPWLFDYRFWVLIAAVVLSEVLAVVMPSGGSISLAYPLFVAIAVLFGPVAASLAAVASMTPSMLPGRRTNLAKFSFNLGQLILTAAVPGFMYMHLGGRLLSHGPLGVHDFPVLVPSLVVVAVFGVFVNFTLASIAERLLYGTPLRRSWQQTFVWMLPSQMALGLVGLTIAQVAAVLGLAGFALFAMPLVVARQIHQRYVELRETYSETVRSLVAAIEAKDPYTKGHSVRVSKYAVGIANKLGLDEAAIERIERAALLHDLGKVGISRSILAKSGRLTRDEYEQVKRHPQIGAVILESVPFLDDVRPLVLHHHERVDGQGYGSGLSGSLIPLEARILSVADSYDAMTSERPYRPALSRTAALDELYKARGSQFEPSIVDAFIVVLPVLEGAVPDAPIQQRVVLADA